MSGWGEVGREFLPLGTGGIAGAGDWDPATSWANGRAGEFLRGREDNREAGDWDPARFVGEGGWASGVGRRASGVGRPGFRVGSSSPSPTSLPCK
jgi:hypothetical protein